MANPLADLIIAAVAALDDLATALEAYAATLVDDTPPDPEPPPPIDPIPDPEPDPEPTGRSIWGWNANHCLYYSNGRPWNNKALLTSIHTRPGATFDKFGQLTSGEGLLPIWLSAAMAEPGTYRVNIPGSGSASPAMFELADSVQHQRFDVVIRGDCRGLSVWRDGHSGTMLTPEAIARHRNAGAIRLMDLRHTNAGDARDGTHYCVNNEGSPPIIEQTITPHQAHKMAEESGGTPIWWNFHHRDSDEFITGRCEEFRTLGGTFPIYFEMSNEIWNGTFPVGAWADAQMNEPQEGRYKWLNKRTREMSAIAKSILGERAVVVIGGQCTGPGVAQKVLNGGTDGIDALAIAPYLNWYQTPPATFAEGLEKIRQHTETQVIPGVAANLGIAKAHGLRLVAYEAGVDISWHNQEHLLELYSRLNQSDEVAELYEDFMIWWAAEVDDLCLFYSDTHHTGYGHFGGERLPAYPRGQVVQDAIGVDG